MTKLALVLGAGGTVGIAHHVGVLKALRDECGFDANSAATIIGTSAGSVVGAYVRAGYSIDDLWEVVARLDERSTLNEPRALPRTPKSELTRLADVGIQVARRGLGVSNDDCAFCCRHFSSMDV